MNVADCISEIRKAEDAVDILDRYQNGETNEIASQHIEEIRNILYSYIALLADREIVL